MYTYTYFLNIFAMEGILEITFFIGFLYWLFPSFFTEGVLRYFIYLFIYYNYLQLDYKYMRIYLCVCLCIKFNPSLSN